MSIVLFLLSLSLSSDKAASDVMFVLLLFGEDDGGGGESLSHDQLLSCWRSSDESGGEMLPRVGYGLKKVGWWWWRDWWWLLPMCG